MDAEAAPNQPVPKEKGKVKIVILAVVALLLLGGGGAGFAFFKRIGPFARKATPAPPPKTKVAVKRPTPKPPETPVVTERMLPPTTRIDPDEGAGKLAKLWNEVDAPKLLLIAKDWKAPELARVTAKMDPGKVAEILAAR